MSAAGSIAGAGAVSLASVRPFVARVLGAAADAVTPASEAPQIAQKAWPGSKGDEHTGHCDDSTTRDPPLN